MDDKGRRRMADVNVQRAFEERRLMGKSMNFGWEMRRWERAEII
jgi:hypothetical protein